MIKIYKNVVFAVVDRFYRGLLFVLPRNDDKANNYVALSVRER